MKIHRIGPGSNPQFWCRRPATNQPRPPADCNNLINSEIRCDYESWVLILSTHVSSQEGVLRKSIPKESDEAHFWLNGYVNKQNCRIWSEANPQVYVETPLHPEKLTVGCALRAGGILLQKR
ncbi:hypothetical protein TNCV_2477161 [Trichonephila clavipes]|nr:hypothetical protein TNCV_2477161 [Trichonephila clavipes]